jgi:hypothetical protein
MTMDKKLVFFPMKPARKHAQPISEQHSHMIVSIGGERFAVDFSGVLTELDPEKAQIVAIDQSKRKRSRRSL